MQILRDVSNDATAAWAALSDKERDRLQGHGLAPEQNQPWLRGEDEEEEPKARNNKRRTR